MIYVTGDTHGDFTRFTTKNFPEQKELTKDDYVIICGDFGGVWNLDKEDKNKLDWLEDKPFTTLFLDGNHENFDMLNHFEIKEFHGGKVHVIRENVLHLIRGEVYTFRDDYYNTDKRLFVFGGAKSHDIADGVLEKTDGRIKKWKHDYTKMFRINHVSWWKEELPSEAEMENGLRNLEKHNFNVDYILTHSPYTSVLKYMDGGSGLYEPDILSDYLQQIKQKTEYRQWIFGHMHVNQMFQWDKSVCIYEQISRLL